MIEAGEIPDTIIALVFANATVEVAFGQEGHELGEEILPGIHCQALSTVFRGKVYGIPGGQVEIDTAEIDS